MSKINRSMWSQEQLRIVKWVMEVFQKQTELIIELKKILRRPMNCPMFVNYIALRDIHLNK